MGRIDLPAGISWDTSSDICLQPMQDYTPFIVDDSFDQSALVRERFGDQFHDGFLAKGGLFLPMSGYEKVPRNEMIG